MRKLDFTYVKWEKINNFPKTDHVRTLWFHCHRPRFNPLVRELRFCKPCGVAKKKKKLRIFHKPDSPPLKCQRSRLSPWISRCRRTLPHEGPPPWSSNHASLGLRPGHLKWHAQSTEHSFSLRPSSYPSSKPLTQWMAPSALILPFLHFTHPHVRCRYRGF